MVYITSLHLFGISCSSSESHGIDYDPVTHDSNIDIDDYGGWKTTYYDSNGYVCGCSVSKGTDYSNGTYDKWETTYYNVNGYGTGSSVSRRTGYLSSSDNDWETEYYNANGVVCGESTSIGHRYGRWDTSYYDANHINRGNSVSQGTIVDCDGSYSRWKTIFYGCDGICSIRKYDPLNHCSNGPIRRICDNNEVQHFIDNAKAFYVANAGYINASSCVFAITDPHDMKMTREKIINTLRQRAKNNPGGASEKTLNHYGLGL